MRAPAIRQVDRLVARSVLGAVALAWLVLVALDAFRIFVAEMGDVGEGGYTYAKAASYVLLTIPRRFYEMFGFAALIGGLLGLGGLAGTGELTALRAAGLSKLRICASVALALALLTVGVCILGETVSPWGERRAQALQLAAQSKDIALARGGALWARDGETVIGARRGRARDGGGQVDLDGVRVFKFDAEGRLVSLEVASAAVHADGAWSMHELRRTTFGTDSARSEVEPTARWASGLDPGLLATSIVDPKYMNLHDLSQNITALESNRQDASTYRRVFWERLFYPVTLLVLAFCAMPFAFGTLRSGGFSKRLFLGLVLAIGSLLLQRSVVSVGVVYGVHPALANLAPPLILVAAAWAWFRRHA